MGVVVDQCWAMRQVVGGSDVVPMSWRRAESLLNPAGKGCCVRSGAGVGLTDIDLGSPDRHLAASEGPQHYKLAGGGGGRC